MNKDFDAEREWTTGVFSGYFVSGFTCVFGTCFPCCALASAKSQFDGSDLLFNCLCFSTNVAIVRNYIRSGYEINGTYGTSDMCLSLCCWPCVITQLLNEGTYNKFRFFATHSLNSDGLFSESVTY